MQAIHVIKRPLITEKSTWESGARNRYSFEVAPEARKPQIKQAIEELYKVRVQKVSTQMRKGKTRRTKFGVSEGSDWKRATVQLHPDDRIELF
jgi:large subunit ribosomal protein L23